MNQYITADSSVGRASDCSGFSRISTVLGWSLVQFQVSGFFL